MYFIGRGMHRHGVVTTGDVLRWGWQHLVFRLVGERHGHLSSVRDRSLALGPGVEVEPLVALGEQIYDASIADRILAETVALARGHLDRGQDVIIVTAALIELAQIVAGRIGLTDALGTVSEVADGRWMGRLCGEFQHGPAKADAIGVLAAARGYDLDRCSAYSDSINDLPMLQCVGEPHAVNPDRRVRPDGGAGLADSRLPGGGAPRRPQRRRRLFGAGSRCWGRGRSSPSRSQLAAWCGGPRRRCGRPTRAATPERLNSATRRAGDGGPPGGTRGPARPPWVMVEPRTVEDPSQAALAVLRRRETVRVVVASCAAMSRIELPRSVSRRTTSSCSAGVRRSRRMPSPATASSMAISSR